MARCDVTYSDGRSAWIVSRCECGFWCAGKCTIRGAFCGVATDSDPCVGKDDGAVESIDIVRPRSMGMCDCMGGVDSECVGDVDGCPAVVLERRLSEDGVWMARILVSEADAALPTGSEEES
jgi:hypothetical protein